MARPDDDRVPHRAPRVAMAAPRLATPAWTPVEGRRSIGARGRPRPASLPRGAGGGRRSARRARGCALARPLDRHGARGVLRRRPRRRLHRGPLRHRAGRGLAPRERGPRISGRSARASSPASAIGLAALLAVGVLGHVVQRSVRFVGPRARGPARRGGDRRRRGRPRRRRSRSSPRSSSSAARTRSSPTRACSPPSSAPSASPAASGRRRPTSPRRRSARRRGRQRSPSRAARGGSGWRGLGRRRLVAERLAAGEAREVRRGSASAART